MITIVMVVCQADRQFLPEALASCFRQGDAPEVLLVDVRPTLALPELPSGVQVIRLVNDPGLAAARNTAIAAARGEFVICLDPDDWLYDGVLPKLAEGMADADVAHGNLMEGDVLVSPSQGNLTKASFTDGNPVCQSSLFRKELWRKIGGYTVSSDEPYFFEDWNFWAKAFAAGGRFKYLDLLVYNHRDRADGRTAQAAGHWKRMRSTALAGVFVDPYRLLSVQDVMSASGDPRLYKLVPALKHMYTHAASVHKYLVSNKLVDENGKLRSGPGCTACRGRIVLHVCQQLYMMFLKSYCALWNSNPAALAGLKAYFGAEKVAMRNGAGRILEV